MNAGSIWWNQIGNSLRLIARVTERLRDSRSFVLRLGEVFPWRYTFYDCVEMRRAVFGNQRRMVRLAWPGGDVGQFVLDVLCEDDAEVRFGYYPGMTHARYLGGRGDSTLCEKYVWITGIHSKQDLERWDRFVTEYESASKHLEQRAVFVLEYDGPDITTELDVLKLSVAGYDCRVFCLEAAAALGNTDLPVYQAELALSIAGANPEYCAALLRKGEQLLLSPWQTVCATTGKTSDGTPYPSRTEPQVTSAAWKSAVVLYFPVLERCRMDIVTRYEQDLRAYLPFSNSFGEQVTHPFDLEIGAISYISGHRFRFPQADAEMIRLCHRARNLLAHNEILPYQDAKKLSEY